METIKTTADLKYFERYLESEYKWTKDRVLVKAVPFSKLFKSDLNYEMHLPVFGEGIPFGDLIPKADLDYVFDSARLKRIIATLMMRKPPMLIGPQGCGKSSLFEQFYARMLQPAVRIQCTSSMDSEYLFGSRSLISAEGATQTGFVDGQLTGPRRHHINLLLDEVTHLNEMVSPDLNSYLEMKTDVRLTCDGFDPFSKVHQIAATPFQDVWLTSNTGGREEVEGFGNNSVLNPATMDRVMMIDVDYLSPELELQVFNKKCPNSKKWHGDLIKFLGLVRGSYKKGHLPKSLSTRSALDFLEYSELIGDISIALVDSILAKYEKSNRTEVLNFFKTTFDIDVKVPSFIVEDESWGPEAA